MKVYCRDYQKLINTGSETANEEAYTAFVTCLKYDQNYAPAYTSLGIFYADVAHDSKRAYKCFQKAFELDAGEVDAAERLARDFANTRQWDLVEVVAERVLQTSRTRIATNLEAAWPHRALGVAELVCCSNHSSDNRGNATILKQYSHFKQLSGVIPTIFILG